MKSRPLPDRRVACIGKFDALHRGHRSLVERAAAAGHPVLLTFDGMPAELGWPRRLPLVPRGEWPAVLAGWGVAATIVSLTFTDIRDLSPAGFVLRLRDALNIAGVVVGDDFRFGRERAAGVAELAQLCATHGLDCEVVPPVTEDDAPVSSSAIRDLVGAGDIAAAARQLGRPYRLHGVVAHGDGRGHSLGFPTANLVDPLNLPPGEGVYAGHAHLEPEGCTTPAALSIGHLPTIAADHPLAIEAHLLDYHGDCYGHRITLDFERRLRDQHKFDSLAALHDQIALDVADVRTHAAG